MKSYSNMKRKKRKTTHSYNSHKLHIIIIVHQQRTKTKVLIIVENMEIFKTLVETFGVSLCALLFMFSE